MKIEEVKPGDRIKVTYEIIVHSRSTNGVYYRDNFNRFQNLYLSSSKEIELIDRPLKIVKGFKYVTALNCECEVLHVLPDNEHYCAKGPHSYFVFRISDLKGNIESGHWKQL